MYCIEVCPYTYAGISFAHRNVTQKAASYVAEGSFPYEKISMYVVYFSRNKVQHLEECVAANATACSQYCDIRKIQKYISNKSAAEGEGSDLHVRWQPIAQWVSDQGGRFLEHLGLL